LALSAGVVLLLSSCAGQKEGRSREARRTERKALRLAEQHLARNNYRAALPHLRRAAEANPQNATTHFRLGKSYMRIGKPRKARAPLKRTLELAPDFKNPEVHFLYGKALHVALAFDAARQQYRQNKQALDPKQQQEAYERVSLALQQLGNAPALVRDSVNALIKNAGEAINSSYPEYVPVISTDERKMIFTSRRPANLGERSPDGLKYEDLYIAERSSRQAEWQPARNMGEPINTPFHEACSALSPDGQKLFLFRGANRSLYTSELQGTTWTAPQQLPQQISSRKSFEPHACLSPDGQGLFFVSDREGGRGGLDLYWARRGPQGGWTDVQNLGPALNTEYDDRAPFLHPNGRTLYFASEGHNSMGGLDIFKSTLQPDSSWSDPVNIGYPINSADHDVYFVMAANGEHAYYASNKPGGYGERDIYRITFRPDTVAAIAERTSEKPRASDQVFAAQPTLAVTVLRGQVTDSLTGQPLQAELVVTNNATGEVISRTESNKASGNYLVTLPAGRNYGIAVAAEGYLFHSEHFNLPDSAGYREVNKAIALLPLAAGSKVVLENIFFDFDQYTLREASEAELQRLYELLKQNPDLKIQINGHTDSRGSKAYNKELSRKRARAVVRYLAERGIDKERLAWKGFGESQPIAPNDTEAGRQKNRRTEFKILKK
jgi:outer membrane protein OmpA-like peptidoglycan-associated protein